MLKTKFSQKCHECGSTNLISDYESGETACSDCGLVTNDVMVDMSPEWRAFTLEERKKKTRVGAPTSYSHFDKGLSTSIGSVNRDAYGKKLSFSTKRKMWRLKKWHIRSKLHASINRNLSRAMSELGRLSDVLHISKQVKERAAIIYRKALNKGLVRGRSIVGIAAASLYAAFRITGTPRSLREIIEASKVDGKNLARNYRLLLKELKLKVPIRGPKTFLSTIAEKTDISGRTQGVAVRILEGAREKHLLAGKNPAGLAASILYSACQITGETKTQKQIAQAAGVTEVTIRNRRKDLKNKMTLDRETYHINHEILQPILTTSID